MSRKPSAETKLRNLKREYRLVCKQLNSATEKLVVANFALCAARKEIEEWKSRFDSLLQLQGKEKAKQEAA